MENDLPAVAIAVDYESVAVLSDSFLFRQPGGNDEQVSQCCLILLRGIIYGCDGLIGDNQYMGRGLWADIAKSCHLLVPKDDVSGQFAAYNLAENGIFWH